MQLNDFELKVLSVIGAVLASAALIGLLILGWV